VGRYYTRVRTPGAHCAACGQPIEHGRASQVCSPACRTARWRQIRVAETAATIALLQTENAMLRQRVVELEHLVGQLKTRLWKGRGV
jgi:predicted nucleic acid-binding Zn ribbon protein